MMSFLECCFENLPLTIKTCINKLNEVLHSRDKYIFHVKSRVLKYLSSVFVLFVFWSICLANAGGSESIQISTLTMCCHHFTNANAQDNEIYDWNEVFIHLISSKIFKAELLSYCNAFLHNLILKWSEWQAAHFLRGGEDLSLVLRYLWSWYCVKSEMQGSLKREYSPFERLNKFKNTSWSLGAFQNTYEFRGICKTSIIFWYLFSLVYQYNTHQHNTVVLLQVCKYHLYDLSKKQNKS